MGPDPMSSMGPVSTEWDLERNLSVGQHLSERRGACLALPFFCFVEFTAVLVICWCWELAMRFKGGWSLLWQSSVTNKQKRKVNMFLRNEMFITKSNIDICEPSPIAGVKRKILTSWKPQSSGSSQTLISWTNKKIKKSSKGKLSSNCQGD